MVLPTNGTVRLSDVNKALFFTAGNVGVNTTTPSQLLDVNGTFKTSSLIAGSTNTIGSLITANGNIGIGTTSPSHSLEVITTNTRGCINLETGNQNRKVMLWDATGNEHQFFGLGLSDYTLRYQVEGSQQFAFYAGTGINSSQLLMQINGSNVGIGTASPSEKLHVEGNIRIGNSTQSNYITFLGTSGDDGITRSYIGERIYGGGEQSELLLVKGNDSDNTYGPDRIRLLAPEHRFDIMTDYLADTFDAVGATASRITAMTITSRGNIGIGTTDPNAVLLNIDGMTAQYSTGIRLDESSHATSNRQAIYQSDWWIGQDLNGNGTRDFWIYQDGGGARMFINTNGMIGFGVTPLSRVHVKSEGTGPAGLNNNSDGALCLDNYGVTYWLLGVNQYNSLIFSNGTTYRGFLNPSNVGQIDFTGQHRCQSTSIPSDISSMVGYIVKSTGIYNNLNESNDPTINESLPEVELTTSAYDIAVYGVLSDIEESSTYRKYQNGNFGSPFPKSEDDNRLIINSLGEGGIWVCNANGNLDNGDYITSSQVPGIGMRQESEYLFNYTVAKATCSIDFGNIPSSLQKRYLKLDGTIITENEYNQIKTSGGEAYISVFIGCTYHCG